MHLKWPVAVEMSTVLSRLQQSSYLLAQTPRNFKMHKFVLVSLALFAVALAAPQQHPEQHLVYTIKQDSDISPEGYNFDFETSDGTARQETGTLKQVSEDHKAIEVQGSYKYTGPDGLVYTVTFVADEHGFQPQEHVSHPGQ